MSDTNMDFKLETYSRKPISFIKSIDLIQQNYK